MAVLPDYVTGTITLANGSTTVTGTGTMFATAAFRPGDTLQIQNLTAIIASVNSNTSLTLTAPWTGTSLTNAPYRARYLPDGARVTAQTTTLIELLGNGVLTNLAELGVEEGKVPVGGPTGEYELKGYVPDTNGTLAKLAASTPAANRSLQTDNSNNIVFAPLGLELIASDTNNSEVAAWVKTGLGTTYREIFMFVDAAPVNSGGSLNIQLSSDNGATWLTATSDYEEQALAVSGNSVVASRPSSPGIGSGATGESAGGGGAQMQITLTEFNQFRRSPYTALVTRKNTAGLWEIVNRSGNVVPWAPFNALRLVCSNGNLARFRVVLMGVRG
ncbi:hypothetical protein [Brucella intermedia]|uniref:hypothetical protein n=1 Tax=Brucella intermedia TaxID=94625 RepID=UPI00165D0A44|nr:hypothetical protein [Brucella intermedia]QNQ39426.1 hypothetical protein IAR37_08550 [Brucella intermedia]